MTSMPPAWWTVTSCTLRRSSSAATTAARSSPALGLAQLGTCGEAGWCRSRGSERTCAWRWPPMGFSEVQEAIDAIGRLGMAVVVDDEDSRNEGDLVMAAEAATPENIAFGLTHAGGDLRPVVARAGRCPRPTPDGDGQHRGPADGVHGERRLPARDDHRHLRRGPVVDHRGADRPEHPAERPQSPRAHLPAALPAGGRAQAGRAHRGDGH